MDRLILCNGNRVKIFLKLIEKLRTTNLKLKSKKLKSRRSRMEST